jgi:CheY-like chemotaxis protein
MEGPGDRGPEIESAMERRPRILVVEDNETNLMIFRDILTAAGHEVLEAASAEDAFAIAREKLPDLILMDIQLPGMDGLDAVRGLKGDEATSSIPIVALTAHAMSPHRDRAMEAGCCGYITKPIRTKEFREKVKVFLEKKVDG